MADYKTVLNKETGALQRVALDDLPVIRSDMTKEQWNALADSKLQELLQTASGSLLLAVIRESKDRLDGKPRQQIDTTLTGTMQTIVQIVRFSDGKVIDQPKSISGIEDAKIIEDNGKSKT